jgi:hypothetical protein
VSPTSLENLDRRQQRRVVGRSAIRILVAVVLLFALYGALPAADRTGIGTLVELFVGLMIFGAVLGYQVLKIMGAEHPELRAAEALGIAVPVVLIVFSFTYLSLDHAEPASFSQHLNHVRAVYFVITVISTVGFGDIVPRTNAAMVLVSFQIMLDLVLLVGIVRVVFYAAAVGVRRRESERDEPMGGTIASGRSSESSG